MSNYKQQQIGIEYKNTGNSARGRISSYHCKPQPLALNETNFKKDIEGISPRYYSVGNAIYKSKYTIGFEFEKNVLHRDAIKEYPLFTGFETDSSCGYEVVTHILPLLPSSQWRTKIFSLFYDAEHIIDDQFSPSDYRCGGHITIRVDGYSSAQLVELLRRNVGIIYALFRKRLKNTFCCHNVNLVGNSFVHSYESYPSHCASGRGNSGYNRYAPILPKDNGLVEFRCVSRFTSVEQTILRYQLFEAIVDFSINKPNGTFHSLLKKVEPILLKQYDNDVAKVEEIKALAKDFRRYLVSYGRVIPTAIEEFVNVGGFSRQANRDFNWDAVS